MKYIILILLLSACVSNPKSITKEMVTVEGLGSIGYLAREFPEAEHLNWKYSKPIEAEICIGLSFGGGRLMRNDVTCDLVITLDAREWNASKNDSYVSQHPKHYNFYQTSGLRGYPIKNAINIEVLNVSHTGLPKKVKPEMLKIIEEQM